MCLKHQLLFAFLFLISVCAFSQDYQEYHHYGKGINDSITKRNEEKQKLSQKRSAPQNICTNAVRIGFYITRITLAYDKALTEKWSIGLEVLGHEGTFKGFEGSILGRYYFKNFNSGLFLEEKITYGSFFPTVYDTVISSPYVGGNPTLIGEHQGHLYYYGNTASIGYKIILTNIAFMELLGGIRTGILKYGSTDNQMYLGSASLSSSVYTIHDAFYQLGPGFPIYFNVRFGFQF